MNANMLMGLLVVISLLTLLGAGFAQGALVAYYPFDSDYSGLSGYCLNTVPAGKAASGAALSAEGKFGSGVALTSSSSNVLISSLNLFPRSDSSQFSVAAWIKLASTTSYVPRVIAQRPGTLRFQLITSTSSAFSSFYALSCKIVFSSLETTTDSSFEYPRTSTDWTHVACVYNSSHLCVAINGTMRACRPASAPQITTSSLQLYAGLTTDSLRGYMDELKFYDHGLTPGELELLNKGTAANDAPAATITAEGIGNGTSWNVPTLSNLVVNATGVDQQMAYSGDPGTELWYTWTVLSSACEIAEISNTSVQAPKLMLNNLGAFELRLCVTDGELSSAAASVSVLATASTPAILSQPDGPNLNVPLGAVDFEVVVLASGLPRPTYQWQYLTLVPVNATANSTTPDSNDTLVRRSSGSDDEYDQSFYADWAPQYRVVRASNGTFTEVWNNIAGATESTFYINGTDEFAGMVIRCLITNSANFTTSTAYTVVLVSALPSPSAPTVPLPGDGGSDSGPIVGGVVGGVAGFVLLLLLVLLVLGILLARRSGRRRRQKKLRQPNFSVLAYGEVKDAGSIPKSRQQALEELEQLLISEDGRIVHAMTHKMVATDADKMSKAVMCVFESNQLGYQILEQRISREVEAAPDAGTLFRSNSLSVRMFSFYVRMVGLQYLWFTLVTSVHSLNDNAVESFGAESEELASKKSRYKLDKSELSEHSGFSLDLLSTTSMEIDPHRIDDASDTTINSLELWLAAQKLFKCIVDSEKIIPTQIKQLMRHIDSEVGAKYDAQAQFRSMGGFLFLRMLCPALMAPQVYGLLDSPPHPVAQRQLILVAKVLQNLANDTLPGTKEAYMEQLNSFIVTNKASLERFYAKVLEGADRGRAAETEVPLKTKFSALNALQRYLSAHIDDVEHALRHDDGREEIIDELKAVLAQLNDDNV